MAALPPQTPEGRALKKTLIAEKFGEILQLLGLDLRDPLFKETPERVAKMYVDEIFSGLDSSTLPEMHLETVDLPEQMLLIKNISFVSFCAHHFVPFTGRAHIGYFASRQLIGLSKIPQLVRYFAKKPQLQERLTAEIAEALAVHLQSKDLAISLSATHFCMRARGIEENEAEVETHLFRGRFESESALRAEFFAALTR